MTTLTQLMAEKILILDGATGTALQKMNLTAADFGGPALEGCNEHLVLSKPEAISAVHESYLAAGADIIETNSFGSTPLVLAEYGLADKAHALNRAAAQLAKSAAAKHSTPQKPRFVAGSVGPTTKSLFVTGGATFDQLVENFQVQGRGLLDGGVDLFLVETCQDSLNIKAALIGLDRAMADAGRTVPVSVSATIEMMGTTLAGQGIEALYYSFQQRNLLTFGINCATGPDFMADHIRTLSEICRWGVSCYPNAGLPDEEGRYNETPEMIAKKLERFVDNGWVNLLGGCCGTTPDHVRLIARMADGKKPRRLPTATRFSLSGLDPLVVTDEIRPVAVGERTNVIGSRKFKEMIVGGHFEEASEIGRKQARAGAPVIDVCLANPDRNEKSDMEAFLGHLTKKVKTPLMIDSTDPAVMEAALKLCPGRSVINSVNLEDGEERFAHVARLIRDYGAAVVVGCIDEDKAQGMAVTRDRKLAVARRAFTLLTQKEGLFPEDIIFDPLVFPAATGDKNYIGSARETIEGVRMIKASFPRCKTILGVSNVSFGLPESGREVMNAVFLHDCVKAGLDFAIVNAEKLARYASIPVAEIELARSVLFATPDESKGAVDRFTAHFRGKASVQKTAPIRHATPEERIAQNVVDGSKEGLFSDLDALLEGEGRMAPLGIVNGPLMKGMDAVGRLFAKNEMIVAEVLQSAEVMKAAVAHLEPHMSKADAAARGTMVLATVKGDVHDIGKNLVHIILKNNGFRVIDLGIKCPPEELVRAVQEHRPDMVGLSGLLVKSAQQMVVTAEDMKVAGVNVPVLVGGAALSEKFTSTKISPAYGADVFYAKDAMAGLDLANRLMEKESREKLVDANRTRQSELRAAPAVRPSPVAERAVIDHGSDSPLPPDLKPHVWDDARVEDIFQYINPVMLYGKHLGLRGTLKKLLDSGDEKAIKLHRAVTDLQGDILARGLIKPRAVWRFFCADSDAETLRVYDSPGQTVPTVEFAFPRRATGEGLCLADFVRPAAAGKKDFVAFFVVTCGQGILELSRAWMEKGDYLKSHAVQAVAIESAEAFAELLHERIRAMWGFPDGPALTMSDKFQTKYRGLRVSFGYPACPNLEDQRKLFRLLDPGAIGVTLTENDMMEPEASVSALVFHHPQARYFSVHE
jgi:5-methyltetrahydrofolate--homocysteine methyltransferase